MALKAIFFDAAGTLFKTTRPVGEIYASFARQYGVNIPLPELAARFRSCFSSAPPLAFPNVSPNEIPRLERRWWHELVQEILAPYGRFARFDDYFSALFEHFSKPQAWMLYPETEEAMRALRQSGLTLAVITNFDSRVLGILEGLGVSSCFDSVLLSSRVGYAKPAREIFQAALSLHSLQPDEAMHVGDSPLHDIAGAAGAGLTAVLVDRDDQHPQNSGLRVQNLNEICSLLSDVEGAW
jgi:putative hydrolase of the HAD superfamily